ncbi:hypothetical protein H6G89_12235 [Oscillatoria sp. FACHB-1407]|uniref:hypothetical protein n=1 Tax=Oscillatoria sp. FACHB-1407 TaxID=2692847 RepID=UPI0016875AE2|nr:hypothetical protein [Oscillatoria sp. FACHB-1407]MBD2461818.1 hypothetical protein [Oscillatoria sp. FACHB-1407]
MNPLPFLLTERSLGSQLFLFKFWFNGKIYDGLRYQGKLFHLCCTFQASQRDKIYEIGCEFERKGIKVAITFTGKEYRLWTDLCSFALLPKEGNPASRALPSIPSDAQSLLMSDRMTTPTHPNQRSSQLMLQSMQC